MIAQKPKTLNFIKAASAPVVTVTAWQMLFDYAQVTAGQTVLIHGAAGNVGAYAVQLASQARLHVIATAASADVEYVRGLGAERILDYQTLRFEESLTGVDVVLDTVGGDTQQRSLRVLKPGGILVSVVSPVPETIQKRYGVRSAYFYVECDYRAAEQDHRTIRQRKTGYGRRHCALAGGRAHRPRDACRPPASPRKDRARCRFPTLGTVEIHLVYDSGAKIDQGFDCCRF